MDDRASTADFESGDRVVYRDWFTRKAEDGVVTSTNAHNVFVCFGLPGSTSQACDPRSLEHFRGGSPLRANEVSNG